MTHKITQCPKCATAFRVTDAQLAVAKGAVRCGACLHIFNANDHWRSPPPATVPAPVVPSPPEFSKPPTDNRPLAPAEPDLDFEPVKPAAATQPEREERFHDDDEIQSDHNHTTGGDQATIVTANEDDDFLIDDAADEDDLIADTESRPLISSDIYADDDLDNDKADADEGLLDDAEALIDLDGLDDERGDTVFKDLDDIARETRDGADEQWARVLLEELEDEPAPPSQAKPAARPDPLLAHLPEVEPQQEDDLFNDDRDQYETWEPAAIEALMAGDRIGEEQRQRPGLAIEPEPLELVLGAQRRQRWRSALELGACALAVLLLAVQVVYFNFDRWSRGPERETLASFCTVFGCELASPIALNEIRTSNLIVRSHPQQRGALIVDAVITNTASYPQPFPNLLLQFSDMNGAPVAGRVFNAQQYLAGELSGAKAMPSRQPVHISLAILDPGEAATNYHLELALPN